MGNLKETLVSSLKLGLRILVSLIPYIVIILIGVVVGLIFKNSVVGVLTFFGLLAGFIIYIMIRTLVQKIKDKRKKE